MATARIRVNGSVLRGDYDDGTVTVDGERYVVGTDAELLAPVDPSTVYCLGRNYEGYLDANADVLTERFGEATVPEELHFFLKGSTCVVGPGDPIPYPTFSDELGYAGELAAVVGERCKHVAPADVADVVAGYTVMNDLTAKDQPRLSEMKVFDGSAPLGPVVADVDPSSLDMQTTVDGEVVQEANTSEMVRSPATAVAALSERVTLRPGDVVAMGSPANPGTVDPGDEIAVWYEGVGTLRNTVAPPERA